MGKRGPKPKRDRAELPVAFRPHIAVKAVLDARADKLGIARADYVDYLICKAIDMPEYAAELPDFDNDQGALFEAKIA